MSARSSGTVTAIAALPVMVFGLVFGIVLMGGSESGAALCNPEAGSSTSLSIDPATVPDSTIEGYGHDQLINAAHVVQAGEDLGLGVRDQTIGVMTAMGESGLTVLDRGDAAGPDSRGLFQQRDNGSWGSYEDRMDPYLSSTNFFRALMEVPDRESLEPTILAHRTQRNADPYHYTQYWDAAVAVVETLAGADTGLRPGNGSTVCSAGQTIAGEVSPEGWAQPAAGPVNSRYGMRLDPVTKSYTILHTGTDFQGGGDGGPIWSAQDGTVVDTYTDPLGSWVIDIDHGNGLMTRYKHMWSAGVLVRPGDPVSAGDQIGRVGSSGHSTGPHLHFEVHVNGSPVDPEQFFGDIGITFE